MKRTICLALTLLLLITLCTGCALTVALSGRLLETAGSLAGKGKYSDAEQAYKLAITLSPKDAQAYIGLADVYVKQGDAKKAQKALEDGYKATGGDSAIVEKIASTQNTATPAPSATPAGENDAAHDELKDAQALYLAYVKETLVPQYGLSSLRAVQYLHDAEEPQGNDDRCLGLMCAKMADLDGDGAPELITAVCQARRNSAVNNPDNVVTLLVYTIAGGKVTRVPGPEDGLVSTQSDEESAYFGRDYTLDLRLDGIGLIYSHVTDHGGDTDWQTFQAFRMEDGVLRLVMDAVEMDSPGEFGIVARVLPEWIKADFAGVQTQSSEEFGRNSVVLFADCNGGDFYTLPGAFRDVYKSMDAARNALLQPIAKAPVEDLLNPLWEDRTGLYEWLNVPAPAFTPPAPTPSPTPQARTLADFIYEGKSRVYAYDELPPFTQDEVALIRNGMYALSGKIFTKDENNKFFSSCWWYTPVSTNVDQSLNKYQKANIELIVQFEKDQGWR